MPTIVQQAKDGVVRDFRGEVDNGNSGAAKTIDWGMGQKQKLTLTAACAISYTDPPGVGNFILKLVQGGAGGYTVTWPGTVKWPSSVIPVISPALGNEDLISVYFDGSTYYQQASQKFG